MEEKNLTDIQYTDTTAQNCSGNYPIMSSIDGTSQMKECISGYSNCICNYKNSIIKLGDCLITQHCESNPITPNRPQLWTRWKGQNGMEWIQQNYIYEWVTDELMSSDCPLSNTFSEEWMLLGVILSENPFIMLWRCGILANLTKWVFYPNTKT